jgi:hypothetical protein
LKKALKVMAVVVLAIVLLGLWFLFGIPTHVNTSYATKAILDGEHGIVVVTDAKDVKAIGNILDGWTIKTTLDTAFTDESVSITMTDGHGSAVFYPCLYNDDRRIQVGNTENFRHLSVGQKKMLDEVLKKHGMVIP